MSIQIIKMKNKKLFLASGFWLLASLLFAQTNPNFNYTQTCFGNQTTLVASSSLPDASISSWQWDLDENGTYELSGKTIISLITLNDTIAVKLKITPNIGTADSITKDVIIDPLPQVNFFVNNLCQGKTATYISQSTISSGSITQYVWDFHNDGSGFGLGDTAIFNNGTAGTYLTKLTCTSDKGCSGSRIQTTEVYATPQSVFSTSNVCLNKSAIFTNSTSLVPNMDSSRWNFGDGSQNVITSGNATHKYAASGNYTVTLIASTQSGCRDTSSQSITVLSLPTNSIFPSGTTTFCTGNTVMLDAGNSFSSYSWSTGSSAQVVSVAASGNYSVTVTDVNGCSNTASIPVVVNPLPVVYLTANGDTVLHAGSSVQLIANGADSYVWNTSAPSNNPNNITVDSIGTYIVTGTDLNNCSVSDSIIITMENSDTVSVISNILTPNGDGINDELKIFNISAYASCELTVYNMWNDAVYNVKGYKNDWKGTNASGANLSAGPYYYIITCDDKPLQKGNINILR